MFAVLRHAEYSIATGSLTPTGIEASKKLAETLRRESTGWKKILTSQTPRTREMAVIFGQEFNIPVEIDPRLRMNGNFRDFFPPNPNHELILVSHLPLITRILRMWSAAFNLPEPPLTQIGAGYVVDDDAKRIVSV